MCGMKDGEVGGVKRDNNVTYFAESDILDRHVRFGIKREDRKRHMHVLGKTGTGKSTLLQNMAIQDIQNGEGVCYIMGPGTMIGDILDYVPEERLDDVIYIDPYDTDCMYSLDIFADVPKENVDTVVDDIVDLFHLMCVDSWNSRIMRMVRHTTLALIHSQGSSLPDMQTFLNDKKLRKEMLSKVEHAGVKKYFEEEFDKMNDGNRRITTEPVLEKLSKLLENNGGNIFLNVGKNKDGRTLVNIEDVRATRKILILDLSLANSDDERALIAGHTMVAMLALFALSCEKGGKGAVYKEGVKPLSSAPLYVYVDNFIAFGAESFETLVRSGGKNNICLAFAHLYLEQLSEEVRKTVLSEVATTVAFRLGPFDAEIMETKYEPRFGAKDLADLPPYYALVMLMIDGGLSAPFLAKSLPPTERPKNSFTDEIIEGSVGADTADTDDEDEYDEEEEEYEGLPSVAKAMEGKGEREKVKGWNGEDDGLSSVALAKEEQNANVVGINTESEGGIVGQGEITEGNPPDALESVLAPSSDSTPTPVPVPLPPPKTPAFKISSPSQTPQEPHGKSEADKNDDMIRELLKVTKEELDAHDSSQGKNTDIDR